LNPVSDKEVGMKIRVETVTRINNEPRDQWSRSPRRRETTGLSIHIKGGYGDDLTPGRPVSATPWGIGRRTGAENEASWFRREVAAVKATVVPLVLKAIHERFGRLEGLSDECEFAPKVRFSRTYFCSCGCSPMFVMEYPSTGWYNATVVVEV
jgi:hypothetical protein